MSCQVSHVMSCLVMWGPAFCMWNHRNSAMALESETPRNPIFFKKILKCWVFGLKTPRFVSGFFRRSFCEGRELRRSKSDHVHPAFSCFFPFLTPQKSHENPRFSKTVQNLAPWDHAQMIERKILCRIALTRALYDQIRP